MGLQETKGPIFIPFQRKALLHECGSGEGLAGTVLSDALDFFDDPNWARPMYVSAHFDEMKVTVANAKTYYEVISCLRFPQLLQSSTMTSRLSF